MDIGAHIHSVIGERPDRLSPLSGGCVGEVYRCDLPSGRAVVAKVGGPASGLLLEGYMLKTLAERAHLPVPDVLHASDALLVMTMLPNGGGLGASVQTDAADIVADLHGHTTHQGFGFECDTVIGGLHQPNPWTPRWVDFFRDQRLMHMGREALKSGRLPSSLMSRIETFCGQLPRWIEEPAQPSLIHGDMWSGNVLSHKGRISGFIDPAIYYADAEIELAFTTLFATFGDAFFSRYTDLRPIRPGFFEERRDIYNLYPLLVHVRLFGGSYVGSVERTLNRFGF